MAAYLPVLAVDFDSLFDCVQKGNLRALQGYLHASKPLRSPDDPKRAANLLQMAVTTGFHSIVAELLLAGGWSLIELTDALALARSLQRDDLAQLIEQSAAQPAVEKLSRRTRNCLVAAGIPLDKQAILHALKTGALYPFFRPTLYGKKTHQEICRWVGVDESFVSSNVAQDTRPPVVSNGLSARANHCLFRAGIPVEKEAVRHALQTKALVPGKRPINYGRQTHAELCRWVGVDQLVLHRNR
jgi:hypothetical protein